MKIPFIILAFIFTAKLYGQQTDNTPTWNDTTFISVKLEDTTKDKKILRIEIGQKATIYIKVKSLKQTAIKITNNANKKDISELIKYLDQNTKRKDTISAVKHLIGFDYLIAEQLQTGKASIFYKRENSFVPFIFHRLEKYGMYAHRFFYLPDKRPFYSIMEYSGIIEDNKYMSDPNELVKLGEKLASLHQN